MSDDERPHLSPEAISDYVRAGSPTAFPVDVAPGAQLEIDPPQDEVRLIFPAVGEEPDLVGFERLSVERTTFLGEQGDWFELTVDALGMHYEAYVFLESVIDHLHDGASFRAAVHQALTGWKDLLTSRRRLTDEKVVGLLGELLVLEHAVEASGEVSAVTAWLGPENEEHDFGFETFDAEVKTTSGEARSHVITTESQLEPSTGRTLYLVSLQLTRAGKAADGVALPDVVFRVRDRLERTRTEFDRNLERLGWRDADAELYPTRFLWRSAPRAYLVDEGFPAITGPRLDAVVPQRPLVSGVSYRVDVSHLPHAAAPEPLHDFCEVPE